MPLKSKGTRAHARFAVLALPIMFLVEVCVPTHASADSTTAEAPIVHYLYEDVLPGSTVITVAGARSVAGTCTIGDSSPALVEREIAVDLNTCAFQLEVVPLPAAPASPTCTLTSCGLPSLQGCAVTVGVTNASWAYTGCSQTESNSSPGCFGDYGSRSTVQESRCLLVSPLVPPVETWRLGNRTWISERTMSATTSPTTRPMAACRRPSLPPFSDGDGLAAHLDRLVVQSAFMRTGHHDQDQCHARRGS